MERFRLHLNRHSTNTDLFAVPPSRNDTPYESCRMDFFFVVFNPVFYLLGIVVSRVCHGTVSLRLGTSSRVGIRLAFLGGPPFDI